MKLVSWCSFPVPPMSDPQEVLPEKTTRSVWETNFFGGPEPPPKEVYSQEWWQGEVHGPVFGGDSAPVKLRRPSERKGGETVAVSGGGVLNSVNRHGEWRLPLTAPGKRPQGGRGQLGSSS